MYAIHTYADIAVARTLKTCSSSFEILLWTIPCSQIVLTFTVYNIVELKLLLQLSKKLCRAEAVSATRGLIIMISIKTMLLVLNTKDCIPIFYHYFSAHGLIIMISIKTMLLVFYTMLTTALHLL